MIRMFSSAGYRAHDDVINGNIFRVTGHLCGNSPVPGEFTAQRPMARSFKVFFDLCLVWINGRVNNREADDLRRYGAIMTSL